MMGAYIKNMEKPKSCAECQFEVIDTSGFTRCVIIQEMVVDGNLFNRCPLEEVDDIAFGLYKAYIDGIEPSETPKEIVRCKECKRSMTYTMDSNLPISRWCHRFSVPVAVEDDDYCSYAERRTDDKCR